jgi:hypothetical protein
MDTDTGNNLEAPPPGGGLRFFEFTTLYYYDPEVNFLFSSLLLPKELLLFPSFLLQYACTYLFFLKALYLLWAGNCGMPVRM